MSIERWTSTSASDTPSRAASSSIRKTTPRSMQPESRRVLRRQFSSYNLAFIAFDEFVRKVGQSVRNTTAAVLPTKMAMRLIGATSTFSNIPFSTSLTGPGARGDSRRECNLNGNRGRLQRQGAVGERIGEDADEREARGRQTERRHCGDPEAATAGGPRGRASASPVPGGPRMTALYRLESPRFGRKIIKQVTPPSRRARAGIVRGRSRRRRPP